VGGDKKASTWSIARLLFEFISSSKPQEGIVTEKADFNEKELHWAKSGYVSDR